MQNIEIWSFAIFYNQEIFVFDCVCPNFFISFLNLKYLHIIQQLIPVH